jgi:hypothetical protein
VKIYDKTLPFCDISSSQECIPKSHDVECVSAATTKESELHSNAIVTVYVVASTLHIPQTQEILEADDSANALE